MFFSRILSLRPSIMLQRALSPQMLSLASWNASLKNGAMPPWWLTPETEMMPTATVPSSSQKHQAVIQIIKFTVIKMYD